MKLKRRYIISKVLILILIFHLPKLVSSQIFNTKHWILSDYIHLEFDTNGLSVEIINQHAHGLITGPFNTAMSADNGDLLFHSSGCFVMDKNSNIMENGDSINPTQLDFGYCTFGDAVWRQNVLILKFPGFDEKYLLFTLDMGRPFPWEDTMYLFLVPLHLSYHVIDMEANNGLGSVVAKNVVAVTDTLARGYIQACRHANGRDWWVIVPEWNSNCYYNILVSPEGLSSPQKHCTGPIQGDQDWGASVGFSQNGEWFARTLPWIEGPLGYISLFSFDRCSGELTHSVTLNFPTEEPFYTGSSFSPNNRFLYASTLKSLWQFDLSKPDIQNTGVLAGHVTTGSFPGQGSLYFQRLAPDGKIYIACPGNHRFLSTIHYPDKLGTDCGFKEYDLKFPLGGDNYGGLPNYPNYRLGPLDGSGCDTLDINNIPVAYFRYEPDSINRFEFEFTNLSYFEPETFHWDFGDTSTSDVKDPLHEFRENGKYKVCLSVTNEFGSDTFCRTINLLPTGVTNPVLTDNLLIYPNPVDNELNISIKNNSTYPLHFKLFGLDGNLCADIANIQTDNFQINTSSVPDGIYILKMIQKNGTTHITKVVVNHF